MTYAPYVIVLLGALILAGFAIDHWRRARTNDLEPPRPSADDAARATLEAIKVSLQEHPERWHYTKDGLAHEGGISLTMRGDQVVVSHELASSMLSPELTRELYLAVRVRNTRMMLEDLKEEAK